MGLTNTFKKSTRSGSNGQCVEVRADGDRVQVRDSKDPEGGILDVDPTAWRTLISELRAGGLSA